MEKKIWCAPFQVAGLNNLPNNKTKHFCNPVTLKYVLTKYRGRKREKEFFCEFSLRPNSN
jgi:hypothetical protein